MSDYAMGSGRPANGELRVVPRDVEAFPLRVFRGAPRITPFGWRHGPQTVLVKITDDRGAIGWGEVWSALPSGFGVEHRAAFIKHVLASLLTERAYESPEQAFDYLTTATRLLANQCGELGPVAQAIAGVDIALWDLVARRKEVPLWQLLGAPHNQVPVYASGLDPNRAIEVLPILLSQRCLAMKVRLWDGGRSHIATMEKIRNLSGPGMKLMVDANQNWTVSQALRQVASLQYLGLEWLEEPLPADAPDGEWLRLHASSQIPIAAGENIHGKDGFAHALALDVLSVVQPDMCKWGGFSGCLPLARRILATGLRYCPHYLGGGVGLIASANLLATIGGDGMLELDVGENPLRQGLVQVPAVTTGLMHLSNLPGLGCEPDSAVIAEFLVE